MHRILKYNWGLYTDSIIHRYYSFYHMVYGLIIWERPSFCQDTICSFMGKIAGREHSILKWSKPACMQIAPQSECVRISFNHLLPSVYNDDLMIVSISRNLFLCIAVQKKRLASNLFAIILTMTIRSYRSSLMFSVFMSGIKQKM